MFAPSRKIILGGIPTSEHELRDIAKAWLLVSVAFAILLRESIGGFFFSFLLAFLTVGIGFLLHEIAHKIVAQHYGCFAEFRAFGFYLWLAILMSFFGFVFAAPGAVFISGPVGLRRNGIISAAGPITNIALALVFFSLWFLGAEGWMAQLTYYGFYINSWLALFNMLPFLNFDGAKIWPWSKIAYFSIAGIAGALMFLQNFVAL